MNFQCPKCDEEMKLEEGDHTCESCDTSISIDEATEMFDAGTLVGIIDESEIEDHEEVLITDISEDIAALVEGEDLSEAFKEKAKTIFEAAVTSRVKHEVVALEEEHQEEFAQAKTDLIEKVDGYLELVVGEWMEENELAVETGIKADMNESFADGIAELLKKHYIKAPEDRWDIVEGLADKVEALESKLDESMEKQIEASKEVVEAEKAITFMRMTESLADTQKEKLLELSEGIEADSVDVFSDKLETLKESYFGTSKDHTTGSAADTIDEENVTEVDQKSQLEEAVRMLGRL